MVTTENVTINVPVGMSQYLVNVNPETEIIRNALLLYQYILNQTISHGRANGFVEKTQKELAECTGIDQADISKFENGTRTLSVNLLKRLADYFWRLLW